MTRKFRRKEYHRNKRKQRTKLIGEIRQIIEVVLKHCGLQWRIKHGIKFLVNVEQHHDSKQ